MIFYSKLHHQHILLVILSGQNRKFTGHLSDDGLLIAGLVTVKHFSTFQYLDYAVSPLCVSANNRLKTTRHPNWAKPPHIAHCKEQYVLFPAGLIYTDKKITKYTCISVKTDSCMKPFSMFQDVQCQCNVRTFSYVLDPQQGSLQIQPEADLLQGSTGCRVTVQFSHLNTCQKSFSWSVKLKHACSPGCSLCTSYGTSSENLIKHQDNSTLVIIPLS